MQLLYHDREDTAIGNLFFMFGQCRNPIIPSDGSPSFAMTSTLIGTVSEYHYQGSLIGQKSRYNSQYLKEKPKHREHIQRLLERYGCDDLEGFLNVTHAVSLNDTFWVRKADSNLSWQNVSLYQNEFDPLISEVNLVFFTDQTIC